MRDKESRKGRVEESIRVKEKKETKRKRDEKQLVRKVISRQIKGLRGERERNRE